MKHRSLLFLPLLALLTGCFTQTATYQLAVHNKLEKPVTLWLVKDKGPAESGWLTPEQIAESSPPTDDQLPDVVVPPDKTARIGPIDGSFYGNPRATLRIYGGTPTLTQMLAAGRGGLNRYDLVLLPGMSNLQIVERVDGGISAIRVPATQP